MVVLACLGAPTAQVAPLGWVSGQQNATFTTVKVQNRVRMCSKHAKRCKPIIFDIRLHKLCKSNFYTFCRTVIHCIDYGHPERAFFQKLETFGLGQTHWAEILCGIWGISGQNISTILAL
jgi:hypothetical protein